MYLKWWTLPLKIEDTLKMDEKKMSRSMLDVAAYFVAKNRIHNSDDLWFGNENQVGFMVHEWKSDWVYGSGMKIRLGLWFMNENQVGFMVQGWKSGWVYGSWMKIRLGLWFRDENRLGLWFMNENQVGFMVQG